MIWGYHYFWKHPNYFQSFFTYGCHLILSVELMTSPMELVPIEVFGSTLAIAYGWVNSWSHPYLWICSSNANQQLWLGLPPLGNVPVKIWPANNVHLLEQPCNSPGFQDGSLPGLETNFGMGKYLGTGGTAATGISTRHKLSRL